MKPAYTVVDRDTGTILTDEAIIFEVNRDTTSGWTKYTLEDLHANPTVVLYWVDDEYYSVVIKGE